MVRIETVTNVDWANITITVGMMVPGAYLQSLVKIRSVTAEIFLIWTNVARTNVTWTNVTLTVGICSECSQEQINRRLKLTSAKVEVETELGNINKWG